MIEDQDLIVTQFFTLIALFDPVSHLSLFLSTTGDLTAVERRRAALLAVCLAFLILVFFAAAGQFVLEAMGVSLISFQIAGGTLLLLFAFSMVLGQNPAGHRVAAGASAAEGGRVLDVAVYPLATPIIAGPGAMLAMVILTDNNRYSVVQQVDTVVVLAVVLLILLGVFLLGGPIHRAIGQGGTNVLRRIMGVILAALSVNLILNALVKWLGLPPI